jgi:hypothetical protein
MALPFVRPSFLFAAEDFPRRIQEASLPLSDSGKAAFVVPERHKNKRAISNRRLATLIS